MKHRTFFRFGMGSILAILVGVGIVLATTSGPNNPGTAADDSSVGTIAWSNANNVFSQNNTYATATVNPGTITHYLKATNFGFSIPAGATINGITVEWEKSNTSGTNTLVDNAVRIVKGGTIGATDKSSVSFWVNPDSDTYISYGGSSDLWGDTWTSTDINDSTFGAALSGKCSTCVSPTTAQLDHVRITVDYTAAAGSVRATKVITIL